MTGHLINSHRRDRETEVATVGRDRDEVQRELLKQVAGTPEEQAIRDLLDSLPHSSK